MIHPTQADIGRGVVYIPAVGPGDSGTITSFNERFVFVRYNGVTSAATRREDLVWDYA